MKITLFNQQRDLPISASSSKRLVSFLFSVLKIKADEIIVHFVSDSKMREIHRIFFNDPSSTDSMSFPLASPIPGTAGPAILGEVFVCPQVAIEYAKAHDIDPYEEASRYLIHGILHLIGYDDLEPAAKKKMRRKENWCLKKLIEQGNLLCQPNSPQTKSKV